MDNQGSPPTGNPLTGNSPRSSFGIRKIQIRRAANFSVKNAELLAL